MKRLIAALLVLLLTACNPELVPPPPITPVQATPLVPQVATVMPATTSQALLQATAPVTVTLPTAGPGETPTITLDNDRQTIVMYAGQSFLLKLGEGYTWTVDVDNQAVVSRRVNVTVVKGAQGIYDARQPGTAHLSAGGEPACRSASPPCGMPNRLFTITIVVK